MKRDDCCEVYARIPQSLQGWTNLILKNGVAIAVDTVVRFEPSYMLVRGREAGSTDEGRAFFVSYEDIAYIRIDKAMKVGDLKRLYGEVVTAEEELPAAETHETTKPTASTPSEVVTPAPMDPAAIAKQNLLNRIRAARTSTLGGNRPQS